MIGTRSGKPANRSRNEAPQIDCHVAHCRRGTVDFRTNACLKRQLLGQFSSQRDGRLFSRFNFAAREFPHSGGRATWRPSTRQHAPVNDEHPRDDFQNLHAPIITQIMMGQLVARRNDGQKP